MKNIVGTVITINLKNGSHFFINPKNIDNNQLNKIEYILNHYITNSPTNPNISLQNQNHNNFYPQQSPQNFQQPYQPYYQPNFQQPMYNQVPMNKKSVLVAIILHLLLVGSGYAYLNKWGKSFIILKIIFLIER